MRFNKKMYKEAFGKINVPKQEETEKVINQKYKDDILHGRVLDDLAGWDGSNVYYDKKMLKKENERKIIARLPFMIIGIAVLIFAIIYSCKYLDLKWNGTCVKVEYVEKSKYLQHDNSTGLTEYDGYLMNWKKAEKSFNMKLATTEWISGDVVFSGKVMLYAAYDERIEEIQNGKVTGEGYFRRMMNEGLEPNEAYIMVYPEINPLYEYKKGEYVNLYYMEKNGETYVNLRMIFRWWIVFLIDFVVIAGNVLMGRKLIILVKEQIRLK